MVAEARGRVFVTSAPPNPNGDLHIGHLAGPYLGADVMARQLRHLGFTVTNVSYTDDYSCYMPRRARELGRNPYELAHLFGQKIEQTLGRGQMLPDYMTHPLREEMHERYVQECFLRLWSKDALEVADLDTYWCPACKEYLYEAEIRGECQNCSAPSDGLYCEECGHAQDTTGLGNPYCTRCRAEPEIKSQQRIVFPLENYRDALKRMYDGREMRPRIRELLDELLGKPLPITPVCRQAEYGIPVPLENWEGHVLDTWFSGIWGYIAATMAYDRVTGMADGSAHSWKAESTRVYHFLGFDCGFSHAVFWPALLMAHGEFTMPDAIMTNEFYRLEGKKFSTSRNHVIWGRDLFRDVAQDAVRFYLCLTGPETAQTNFALDELRTFNNEVLVGRLQSWINNILDLCQTRFGGRAPDAETDPKHPLFPLLELIPRRVGQALSPEQFSPQRATQLLVDAISQITSSALLEDATNSADNDRLASEITLHIELLARIAMSASPIMPGFSAVVWKQLGLPFQDDLHEMPRRYEGATTLVSPERALKTGPVAIFSELGVG